MASSSAKKANPCATCSSTRRVLATGRLGEHLAGVGRKAEVGGKEALKPVKGNTLVETHSHRQWEKEQVVERDRS